VVGGRNEGEKGRPRSGGVYTVSLFPAINFLVFDVYDKCDILPMI
jgi:hypothetical protein